MPEQCRYVRLLVNSGIDGLILQVTSDDFDEVERHPNPEQVLDATDEPGSDHGKLTIFFGYAAGVGKTYSMLEQAHERLKEGVDVVVGYVEPHTRPETMRLLDGLPAIPVKRVDYHGIELNEFDLDAALERHPQLIIVDELAHTNVEGVRNAKRYQDVEELLQAGIDVYTTVNVQHIESLNNVITDATSVAVRETVPDYVFDRADAMKIIDVEPDELLRRLAEGKIYVPERAQTATENFFTKENLRVLREFAVREAASHLTHDKPEKTPVNKPVNAKLLVYIDASGSSPKCIRWTARMADALFVPWVAVYVEVRDQDLLTADERKHKRENIALAEKLGAEVVTLSGMDVPEAIAEYARATGITSVVVSKSHQRPFRSDFADRLLALLPHMEIHFIPDDSGHQPEPYRFAPEVKVSFSLADTAKMIGLLLAATGVSFGLRALGIGDHNVIMIYILSVLIVSRVTTGFIYGVIDSVLSVLAFNFFFAEPVFTFTAIAPGYPVTLVIMLLIALLTSTLTVRVKAQVKLAVKREQRTQLLYEIGKTLLVTRGKENIVRVTNQYIVALFGRSVAFYTDFDSPPQVLEAPEEHAGFLTSEAERTVASWCFVNQKPAGQGTDTLGGAGAYYLPVLSRGDALGVIGVSCERTRPSTFSRFFLETIVSQVAMALERQMLSDRQHERALAAARGDI